MLPVYSSGDFTCIWNGVKLNVGWGDDQFLTATPNGPLKETMIGAAGDMAVSNLADRGGVITMTFKQTADALDDIDTIAAAEMLVGEAFNLPYAGYFQFFDPLGNNKGFVALNTVLVDRGAHEHQKVMGERTITWNCEKMIFGDPLSIMGQISSFIKD